jgi:hypothetical protein
VDRQSQPKVRFRDHKLVDYEPQETMDKGDLDDLGYDDESVEFSLKSHEMTENEDDEQLEISEANESIDTESVAEDLYSKDDFLDEVEDGESAGTSTEVVKPKTVNQAWSEPEGEATPDTLIDKVEGKGRGHQRKVKSCCSFKESDEYKKKLPTYNGLNSTYGLSEKEVAQRERCQSILSQRELYQSVYQQEQQMLVAKLNEEAFASW